MKTLWIAMIAVWSSLIAHGGDHAPIEVRPFLFAARGHKLNATVTDAGFMLRLFLEIANVSDHPISIAVGANGRGTFIESYKRPFPVILLSVGFQQSMSRAILIPPARELDIVELRPGEAYEYEGFSTDVPMGTRLRDVVFEYVVDEDFGKRFNVWHGKVSSPLLEQPSGRLPPNKPPEPSPMSVTPPASQEPRQP